MFGLKNIQTIIGLLTLFLAYLFTIAPAGYFRSWVAKKMGDSTAQENGFLTLNPLVHIDFFGLLWLLLLSRPDYYMGFGWGKFIPIDPRNIRGSWRWIKLGCAFFSDTFAHVLMATIALVLGSFTLDTKYVSFAALQNSSFSVVIFKLLFAFIGLNISLALICLAINVVVLFALYVSEGKAAASTAQYFHYFVLFGPLVLLLLFGRQMQQLIMFGIIAIQNCVHSLID